MKWSRPYKTARCVLMCENDYFLAVHSSFWAKSHRRWGLPGGGVEWREAPEEAVRRELSEELDLAVGDLVELGPYTYKGAQHMIYGADIPHRITSYDDRELLDIGWFDITTLQQMEQRGDLHAGYELHAIETYRARTP